MVGLGLGPSVDYVVGIPICLCLYGRCELYGFGSFIYLFDRYFRSTLEYSTYTAATSTMLKGNRKKTGWSPAKTHAQSRVGERPTHSEHIGERPQGQSLTVATETPVFGSGGCGA